MGTTPIVAMAENRPSTTAEVDACIEQWPFSRLYLRGSGWFLSLYPHSW